MQRAVQSVRVDDKIIAYIASLVGNTRRHRAVQIGAPPRAAIALLTTSRVEAAVQGREFVVPDDVKTHGKAVLRHRLILQPDAEIEGVTTDEVVEGVLHETPVPGMGEGEEARRSHAAAAAVAQAPSSYAPAPPPAPVVAPAAAPALAGQRIAAPAPSGAMPTPPARATAPAASASPSTPPWAKDDLSDPAPAPSAPARPAGQPVGSGPARSAGMDPDTIPPRGPGPLGNGDKSS